MEIAVKNKVITTFLPVVLAIPTSGNITNVAAKDIEKPTAVLIRDSIKDCFLLCMVWVFFTTLYIKQLEKAVSYTFVRVH